jgi:hypothetical protein
VDYKDLTLAWLQRAESAWLAACAMSKNDYFRNFKRIALRKLLKCVNSILDETTMATSMSEEDLVDKVWISLRYFSGMVLTLRCI